MLNVTLQFEDGGEEKLDPIPLLHNLHFPITRIRTISGVVIDIIQDESTRESEVGSEPVEQEASKEDSLPKRGRKKAAAPKSGIGEADTSG